jgi:hypothetical protein
MTVHVEILEIIYKAYLFYKLNPNPHIIFAELQAFNNGCALLREIGNW